ncbi:putative 23S ribosomal protein [Tolypothrix sp. PCC 7601]|nr:putative 23S ribosomal protein [Tolypothrix sp. PCC 7601]
MRAGVPPVEQTFQDGFWIVNEKQFKDRTKQLGLRVIYLVEALPQTRTADVIGKQVLRSATSVGANYRAACRAKSTADLIAKLSIVEEEADETLYWLEILVEAGMISADKLTNLMQETAEILAMTVASIKTLKEKHKSKI